MGDYNSRYKRNDIEDQYLLDSNDIENFKQQQAQDVIDNFMLGDFNSDGNYVVDKSIINELSEKYRNYVNHKGAAFCE